MVPSAPGFEQPDAVFVDQAALPGGRIDLVYRARPGLPASQFTDAGLLITEFQGRPTPEFLKKVTAMGMVEEVTVGASPATGSAASPTSSPTSTPPAASARSRPAWPATPSSGNAATSPSAWRATAPKEEAIRIAESMR